MQIHIKNHRVRESAWTKVVQNVRFSGVWLIFRRIWAVLKFRVIFVLDKGNKHEESDFEKFQNLEEEKGKGAAQNNSIPLSVLDEGNEHGESDFEKFLRLEEE